MASGTYILEVRYDSRRGMWQVEKWSGSSGLRGSSFIDEVSRHRKKDRAVDAAVREARRSPTYGEVWVRPRSGGAADIKKVK